MENKTKLDGVTILEAGSSHVSSPTHSASSEEAPGDITARQRSRKGDRHMRALEITYQKVKSWDSGLRFVLGMLFTRELTNAP